MIEDSNRAEADRARAEADRAFSKALASGRLSRNRTDDNYVGNYMYICVGYNGEDAFKHIDTRKYLPSPVPSNLLCTQRWPHYTMNWYTLNK